LRHEALPIHLKAADNHAEEAEAWQTVFSGVLWLLASLLMVFVFQPILMSYLPVTARKAPRLSSRCATLVRWRNFGEAVAGFGVKAGAARGALLIGAALFLAAGLVSGMRAQVGYQQPGMPLYRLNAKVNRDIRRIVHSQGQALPRRQQEQRPRCGDAAGLSATNIARLAAGLGQRIYRLSPVRPVRRRLDLRFRQIRINTVIFQSTRVLARPINVQATMPKISLRQCLPRSWVSISIPIRAMTNARTSGGCRTKS
jgi:hypothetical protein